MVGAGIGGGMEKDAVGDVGSLMGSVKALSKAA